MPSVYLNGTKVFCPLDNEVMVKGPVVPHQNGTDNSGRPIKVTLKHYQCPKCESVVTFSFREDGKPGELKQALDAEKSCGKIFTYIDKDGD